MEYFDTKIKKKNKLNFLKLSYRKNSDARKQLSYFAISADGKHFFKVSRWFHNITIT